MLPNFLLLIVGRSFGFALWVFIQSVLVWLILTFIVSNIRVLSILSIPFLLVLPAECYFIYTYGYPSTKYVITLLAETSLQEANEFLSGLWVVLITAFVCIIITLTWLIKGLKSVRVSSIKTQVIVLVLMITLITSWQISKTQSWAPLKLRQFTLTNSYPIGIAYRVMSYGKLHIEGLRNQQLVQKHHFSATSSLTDMTLILVIGESSRPDHWGINGYDRQTTPMLSSRSDIYFMNNLITPWALTTYSTPLFIKRKPANFNGVFPEKSLFSAFNDADYSTLWFTNQDGLREMSLHIGEATKRKSYNFAIDDDAHAMQDGEMLPDIDKAIKEGSPKKFIVVHSKGSHWDYYLRYPPEFRKFIPDTIQGVSGKYDASQRESIVNGYDNSILYTDYFLSELIKKLELLKKPAALVYVSDHGEGLYENGCKVFGHGNDTDINFRTAGFIWVSPELASGRSTLVANLSKNTKLPLSTDLTIFNTLADLGGLNLVEAKHSLLNREFETRQRIVNASSGIIDFDHSARDGVCELVVNTKSSQPLLH